ncbi:hypothetical protein LMG31884_33250 [Xanthomonas hydrangeae]|nr:hypothetical protein LMG31884_33250 [Xanthomonas hydrangeae]CAD7721576.1 hypothetical protein LMG31884_33250 [Xanthomonas hydrangeae]CAD7738426.1 hypothetical protein LMG31887_33150 [Xanthomonas hydrangeae]CAD7738429.1 hypothetical protein LMG31887_33150 [Xanthomonas hydrangeae]
MEDGDDGQDDQEEEANDGQDGSSPSHIGNAPASFEQGLGELCCGLFLDLALPDLIANFTIWCAHDFALRWLTDGVKIR